MGLTPDERRGALVLVAILILGAAWDLWRPSPWWRRSPPRFAADSTAVPASPAAAPGHAVPALSDSGRAALDLNRATAAALDGLPGIGRVLAGRIVARRQEGGPYRRPEDLLTVPGIGPRLFARIRPLVTVGPPPAAEPMQSAYKPRGSRADSASAAKPHGR